MITIKKIDAHFEENAKEIIMENISNRKIFIEKCTQCSSCGKRSWYVMKCSCGYIFCRYCSVEKAEIDSDDILLVCPNCGKTKIYV